MNRVAAQPAAVELVQRNTNSPTSDEADDHKVEYPDGGVRAYLVTAGSFFGAVVCLGIINAIGAIQAYVSTNQLRSYSTTTVSWVFSIYLSLTYAVGVIVGPIFDRNGVTTLSVVATILIFGGLMGAANSSKVYQFILSFICLGIGNGVGMTPMIGVINHWFFKKRGTITGIVTSGGSVGGLMFSLLLKHTMAEYNYVWSLRILAFVCLGCLSIALLLIKERVYFKPPSSGSNKMNLLNPLHMKRSVKELVARNKDSSYFFVILGAFFSELALVLLLTYFVTYFMAQGISEATAYSLLTTWNATGILGRLLPGYSSDYVGKFNVTITMTLCLSISIFAMWLPFGAHSGAMFAFAALGGFFQGAISGMLPACLAQITVVSQFGERFGILNFFLSFGNLVGIPIGASVIGDGSAENYDHFVCLVGALCSVGTFFYYCARYVIVGFKINVKV